VRRVTMTQRQARNSAIREDFFATLVGIGIIIMIAYLLF